MSAVSLFAPAENKTPQPPVDRSPHKPFYTPRGGGGTGTKAATTGGIHHHHYGESVINTEGSTGSLVGAPGSDRKKAKWQTVPPLVPKIKATVHADLSFVDVMHGSGPGKSLHAEHSHMVKVNVTNPTAYVTSDTMVIGHPIRLPTPLIFHAPPRASANVALGEPVITPRRLMNEQQEDAASTPRKGLSLGNNTLQKVYAPESEVSPFMSPRVIVTQLKDFNILAQACGKASKSLEEGCAFFNMGVVHDNSHDYERAIVCYKKFLKVCREQDNVDGQAIALNCMGVDYYLLEGEENLAKSLKCHKQHYQLAAEIDKVVSLVNIGLTYRQMGESQKAVQILQEACRLSAQLSDVEGERVASGNLGAAQLQELNLEGAKQSYFNQLELSKAMQDLRGVCSACHQLGLIGNSLEQYAEAASSFEQARKIALALNDKLFANEMGIAIGVARGNALFKERMSALQQVYADNYAAPGQDDRVRVDLTSLLQPPVLSDDEDEDEGSSIEGTNPASVPRPPPKVLAGGVVVPMPPPPVLGTPGAAAQNPRFRRVMNKSA